MSTNKTSKKTLLEKILDGETNEAKKEFAIKRVNRAFESAADDLEEQVLGTQAELASNRETLANAAKANSSLSSYIQNLVNNQTKLDVLNAAIVSLAKEKKELL
jgi:hypothetical protein